MTIAANSTTRFRAALKTSAALLFFLILAFFIIPASADAANPIDPPDGRIPLASPPIQPTALVPFTYARTTLPSVPVYADPADETSGIPPIRIFDAGFVWLSLADPKPVLANNTFWYKINPEGYVHVEQVRLFQPSAFQGIRLNGQPDKPIAWVVFATRPSAVPGIPAEKTAPLLARYTPLTVWDEKKVGDWTWYKIGDDQWLEQRKIGLVRATTRPAQIGENEKWVDVNLYEQTLAAYEGDRMVYATLVSSGLPAWSTPKGLYRVWAKVVDWKMSGRERQPDYYYLEDVPWILYFNKDVALHGAYWHDGFGLPRSHGCVNLSPADSKWLFGWATPNPGLSAWTISNPDNPGTWVWVH